MVITALMVFVRFFSHAGQMQVGGSVGAEAFGTVLKLIVIMDLRESECLFSGDEAGQRGDSFAALLACAWFVDGVRDGTQNEGSAGLADWRRSTSHEYEYKTYAT